MNRNNKNSTSWQKYLLSGLCAFLALILIVLIFVTAYVESLLNQINRPSIDHTVTLSPSDAAQLTEPTDTVPPDFTGPTYDPGSLTQPTISPTQPLQKQEHIINILLIGQDRREGEPRQRSDSMILCTFNTQKKTITMTSFLRDLYVDIPGYWAAKINAAYQWGGMRTLNETLAINFGVHVDANVEVDFNGFIGIIDLLGGVDINLTAAEARHMNNTYDWLLVEGEPAWNLKEGWNHLNAAQALSYSRIRYIGTDFARTNRQRTVIMALIQAYKNLSLSSMLELLYDILPLITTDMTNAEIINYATSLFPLLSTATFVTQQIPANDAYEDAVIRGDQVLLPDLEVNRQILKNTIME